jgi:hypothetical protein
VQTGSTIFADQPWSALGPSAVLFRKYVCASGRVAVLRGEAEIGVYLNDGSKSEITDTTFSNSGALDTTDYGGAFYLEDDSDLTITGSLVDSNAGESGGGF